MRVNSHRTRPTNHFPCFAFTTALRSLSNGPGVESTVQWASRLNRETAQQGFSITEGFIQYHTPCLDENSLEASTLSNWKLHHNSTLTWT